MSPFAHLTPFARVVAMSARRNLKACRLHLDCQYQLNTEELKYGTAGTFPPRLPLEVNVGLPLAWVLLYVFSTGLCVHVCESTRTSLRPREVGGVCVCVWSSTREDLGIGLVKVLVKEDDIGRVVSVEVKKRFWARIDDLQHNLHY